MSFHAMNRRGFLETATTVTAATLLRSRLGWADDDNKIEKVGVQLYTVRKQMKADFDGTLAKVAAIGYKEVEFAGYFGRTPQQVRAALEKNGLSSPACHVDYDLLAPDKWPAQIESAQVIGQNYIVNPWIPEERRVRRVLPGAVVNKRNGDAQNVSKFLGFQELVQSWVLLGHCGMERVGQSKANRCSDCAQGF
ncbi:MAG: hypothetical protein ABSE40_23640 [Candidatus Sulfotelmatobacter sp.]|jgi:hypothetical protein